MNQKTAPCTLAHIREQLVHYQPYGEPEAADRKTLLTYCDLFDDLLFRKNPIAHFTASALVLSEDRTKTLMAYHNIYRSWSWLGGHADGNGDLLAVALREVAEESGLADVVPIAEDIFAVDILPVWGHWKKGVYLSSHQHLSICYLFEGNSRQPLRPKTDENSAVEWIPVGEMVQRCTEQDMKPVYQKLLSRAREMGELSRLPHK